MLKKCTTVDILYTFVVNYQHSLHNLIVNIATIGTLFEALDSGCERSELYCTIFWVLIFMNLIKILNK